MRMIWKVAIFLDTPTPFPSTSDKLTAFQLTFPFFFLFFWQFKVGCPLLEVTSSIVFPPSSVDRIYIGFCRSYFHRTNVLPYIVYPHDRRTSNTCPDFMSPISIVDPPSISLWEKLQDPSDKFHGCLAIPPLTTCRHPINSPSPHSLPSGPPPSPQGWPLH